MAALRYETVFGADVRPFISDLARLRIQVFAEFPYLYAGELGYEEAYLQHLAAVSYTHLTLPTIYSV